MKDNVIRFPFLKNGDYMLTNERKQEIEKIVKSILEKESAPVSLTVDIVSLVKKDGFLVQTANLPLETTGYLAVNEQKPVDDSGNYHRLIVVNEKFKNPNNEENVVLKKSRFITAHEYGHFILHKPKWEALYAHRDSDRREDQQELEADYFARSILMPAKTFLLINNTLDLIISENKDDPNANLDYKITTLSSLFKVTTDKVKKRLGDIDVITSIVTN